MHTASDEELIGRFLAGQPEAFNQLVTRWEKRIYNFVLRYCGNREEARDLCQDTFAAALQRLSSLQDPRRFSSWLYTIALNCCRMRFRRTRHQGQALPLDDPLQGEQLAEEVQRSRLAPAPDPESAVLLQERIEQLRQALQQLSEDQRLVVILKEYQDLKFQEIADILECPLSTIKTRLYQGLRNLRSLLAAES
jgi:RNA polymerase sigma-70 factor (ECF subfamily)